ncbi:MAG: Hsp20/alpha crystallin family protein [Candidatus Dormibacteraeota bacterium]|nr:Hsp20/alpha crystallin family protein [Candidatus Dormibacteraeota bacterium]MBV9526513.1 Hsp20/alpha crystallin family protein [Candidatus Dormibacteraeota bacterium]
MAIVRWNPWNDLFDLHSQMDELFQSLSGNETGLRNGGGEYANLPVDIRQTDESFVIEASVPGFRPEDVELTFDAGVLTIKGQRKSETEDKQGSYVRRERRQMSVYRQVGLPAEVRAEEISANFDNGVLRVTVPRAQKAQPKRIPVTTGTSDQQSTVIEHQS